jgi:hypothetical protein
MNSFDIIMAARKELAWLQVQHTHQHITAHQSITRQEMDIWGRANYDCNTEAKAKAFWQDEDDTGMKVVLVKLTNKPWTLWIGDEKISTRVRVTMYNHIHDPQAVRKRQECGVDDEELQDMVGLLISHLTEWNTHTR